VATRRLSADIDQLKRDPAGQEPAGKVQPDKDQLYCPRRALDRKWVSYVYKYQLVP
jgi:hypothetical protein